MTEKPLLTLDHAILRQQANPLNSGVMRQIDDVGYILKVDVGVAAHEGNLLRAR